MPLSKLTMTISAVFLGVLGLITIFFPQEILRYFNVPSSELTLLNIQLLGALYFGNAMLNWMSKGSLLGGIYGRPILIGNFTHFFIGAATLIKMVSGDISVVLLILSIFYFVIASSSLCTTGQHHTLTRTIYSIQVGNQPYKVFLK